MSVGSTQFRRINPHPGMMIDADVWRDAHNYHRDQLGLHHLALHGWGIVEGLEVSVVDGVANTLRIDAGYAIDPVGRFIIVPRSQTYQITAHEKQLIFLVLQFRDVLAEPAGGAPTRVIEAYRIQERDRLPEEPYIELARFDFDPRSGAVKAARDATAPARNELDLRSRPHVGGVAAAPGGSTDVNGTTPAAEGVSPRIDSLSQQLGAVAHRVESLAAEVAETRGSASSTTDGAESPGTARLDSLTIQVQQLAGRLESLSSQVATEGQPAREATTQLPAAVAPSSAAVAEQVSMIVADQVSAVVGDQVSAIARRVEAAAQQSDALAQQITAAQQRDEADVQALGARLDDLRREVDALGLQLQAPLHQVGTAPAPRATPAPFELEAAATSAPLDRVVLRVAPAEHGAAGWDAHRDGLRYLARELSAMADVSGQLVDPVRVREAIGVQLLYLSGHAALALDDAEVDAVGRLLDGGAVVVGEGCATGPNGEAGAREFAMSFVDLANRLGRQLTRVDRAHPLMTARHVFGELPSGARATARVLESNGIVYSDADYGCAWQGGTADRPLSRGAIRDALEFGMNLALFRRNGTHA